MTETTVYNVLAASVVILAEDDDKTNSLGFENEKECLVLQCTLKFLPGDV